MKPPLTHKFKDWDDRILTYCGKIFWYNGMDVFKHRWDQVTCKKCLKERKK